MKRPKITTQEIINYMKWLLFTLITFIFSCRIISNAQQTLIEHYDINLCKYKVDTISNNCVIGISFFDCNGNPIHIECAAVDTLPKNLLNDVEWNLMLKNEISKLTREDLYVFIVYGVVVDKTGQVSNIEKLSKSNYDTAIEERIVQLIEQSLWKPAIKDRNLVEYYFSFPVKVNLM